VDRRWTFVSPSADGRTLLLEQDIYSCGDRQAYFLSTRGGAALVAIQFNAECGSSERSGLYRAYPDGSDDFILSTSGDDATLWGSRRGPLTSP
jgi:hypothetical protein